MERFDPSRIRFDDRGRGLDFGAKSTADFAERLRPPQRCKAELNDTTSRLSVAIESQQHHRLRQAYAVAIESQSDATGHASAASRGVDGPIAIEEVD